MCYDETLAVERSSTEEDNDDYESGDPEDTIDLATEASTNHGRTYRLREFCITRWFSAWLVMHRFYSLFEAFQVWRRTWSRIARCILDRRGMNSLRP